IGADDGCQAGLDIELGRFDERLESRESKTGEFQWMCAALRPEYASLLGQKGVENLLHVRVAADITRRMDPAIDDEGRRAGDVVFRLAILRDLVDMIQHGFVADAFVDL